MDAETAALFPERLTESDVGQIPRGWRVGSLLEHAMLLSGGTPKTSVSEYWNGTIPWASAADVSQCGECFLVQPERSITRRGLEESSTKLIPAFSTVVVARGATTGRMCLLGKGMAMNQTCYALRSKSGGDFYLYCRARHEVDDLVHAAHGSVFDTITTSTFEASRVLLPPEAAIRRFDEVVEPSFRSILIRQEESRNLTEIRDTLLPKLLSGELRIRDAEKMVEAHV
jgi:type I restriction enzyme S subunit